MLEQSDAVKQAWQATDRTLDIVINVDGTDYQATGINSLSYDAGAFTGDSLGIGSTYENSISAEFASVIEAFAAGQVVKPQIGIKVNGDFEYTPLGVFIISEVNRDRNNNLTTIKALDQMVKLERAYTSALTYPAAMLDVVAEIASQGGVTVNQTDLTHLPNLPKLNSAITGQTLRTAIGWIAQFYAGFAAFDRDGQLTIRTTATPDYEINPSEYMQGGLTKNEVTYKTGGIKVSVTTTSTTETGEQEDKTTTLQAGETSGSQIELTNNVMTNDALSTIWTSIKDVSFYPYSLNWFGNPALEAGDWVTLTDTQGNQFNVPVNQLTFTFNGGLESTISANQASQSSTVIPWTGPTQNAITQAITRKMATGNNVYDPSFTEEPKNAKIGDVWFKQNGNNVELWTYSRDSSGNASWQKQEVDGEVKAQVDQAVQESQKAVADLTSNVESKVKDLDASIQSTKADLTAATNKVASDLSTTKSDLATVASDLSATKSSLADTGQRLETAVSDFQKKTDQLSGSLETANSKIEFNSKAISEVKQTAEEISTTVADHSGKISNLQQKADSITSTLSNGGVNLLNNSNAFDWGIGGWNNNPPHSIIDDEDGLKDCKIVLATGVDYQGFWWPGNNTLNETYTLSFDAKSDNGIAKLETVGLENNFFMSNPPVISKGWMRYSVSGKVTHEGNNNWIIYFSAPTADNVYIRRVQLEYGDTATPWKPSNGDISQLQQTASQLTVDMKNAKGNISQLQQDANGLTSRVGNAEGNISQLQQTASGLQSTVSDHSGKISNLQQKADSITSTLSNGGVNLLNNSNAFDWGIGGWNNNPPHSIIDDEDGLKDCKIVLATGVDYQGFWWPGNNTLNETYTLSFDAKSDNGVAKFSAVGLENNFWMSNPPTISKDWMRYSVSGKVTQADSNNWVIYFSTPAVDNVYVRRVQLEYGDTATPWKPSNGDISSLQQTANGLNAYIKNSTGSNTLDSLLSMDPNNSTIAQVVNGKVVAAINLSSEGNTLISGKKIMLDGDVTIDGTAFASKLKATGITVDQLVAGNIDASRIDVINLNANNITAGTLDASKIKVINLDANSITTESFSAVLEEQRKFETFTVSSSNTWNFDYTKSTYGNWFLIGETTADHVYNGPKDANNNPITPNMYVTSRGTGNNFTVTVWKDNDPTQYQRIWSYDHWTDWVMLPNTQNIISTINLSPDSVRIAGKKITLDGNVNINGMAFANKLKATGITVDQLVAGSIDASKINVINLNANNITAGTIHGNNLSINLDNGQVAFARGSLHSTDYMFNIDLDNKTFKIQTNNGVGLWIDNNGLHYKSNSTSDLWIDKNGFHSYTDGNQNGTWIKDDSLTNSDAWGQGVTFKNGNIQFSSLPYWSSDNSKVYGSIYRDPNFLGSSKNGLTIEGINGVTLKTSAADNYTFNESTDGYSLGAPNGAFLTLANDISISSVLYSNSILYLTGGLLYPKGNGWKGQATVSIGTDEYYSHSGAHMSKTNGTGRGNSISAHANNVNVTATDWINFEAVDGIGRISFQANYIHMYPTYLKTTSAGANVYVAADGSLVRSTSARKYKTDIQPASEFADYGDKLINLTPKVWLDKAEVKRYKDDPEKNKKPGYYYGLIADELDQAGLNKLVTYGDDGQVEGIQYDRLAVALLPIIKQLKEDVQKIKERILK